MTMSSNSLGRNHQQPPSITIKLIYDPVLQIPPKRSWGTLHTSHDARQLKLSKKQQSGAINILNVAPGGYLTHFQTFFSIEIDWLKPILNLNKKPPTLLHPTLNQPPPPPNHLGDHQINKLLPAKRRIIFFKKLLSSK